MINHTSCGKLNTWSKRLVSGCLPGSVPLRNKILYQLDEVYAKAIDDGVYPSALKAVELNIKMLVYMESPSASLRVADLDTATIKRMIMEIGGDPSLDREPGIKPQINHPQLQTSPTSMETPSAKQEQTMTSPAPVSRSANLDIETNKRFIEELDEKFVQELGLDLCPHPYLHVPSMPEKASLTEEEQIIAPIDKEIKTQPHSSKTRETHS